MRDPMQWIAALGMVIIGILFVLDARQWRQLGSVITRGQRALRISAILIIELLFVLMLIGPYVMGRKDPLISLCYWSMCMVLGLSVVALALLALRSVVRQYSQLSRQAFHDLREHPEDRHEK